VLSSTTLGKLHLIIQEAMGWYNYHLHQFMINGIEYGQPNPSFDFNVMDEDKVPLSRVISEEKFKFRYEYDFGDGWEHDILVEKILPRDRKELYPLCIKGKRACPPEDCGGIWGYQELLETIQNPDHPEYESLMEWLPEDFDPEFFDLEDTNRLLRDLAI
jgi:hypothetical protein